MADSLVTITYVMGNPREITKNVLGMTDEELNDLLGVDGQPAIVHSMIELPPGEAGALCAAYLAAQGLIDEVITLPSEPR